MWKEHPMCAKILALFDSVMFIPVSNIPHAYGTYYGEKFHHGRLKLTKWIHLHLGQHLNEFRVTNVSYLEVKSRCIEGYQTKPTTIAELNRRLTGLCNPIPRWDILKELYLRAYVLSPIPIEHEGMLCSAWSDIEPFLYRVDNTKRCLGFVKQSKAPLFYSKSESALQTDSKPKTLELICSLGNFLEQ
ncbi:hypothetical protein K7432_007557 [Basidiobolus ranarum]|uniref:Uncharacterized protein n=1 Tax=Basidiobolus ranarum TaxID=34480 RepID=A0ABR2WT52_9FUNG